MCHVCRLRAADHLHGESAELAEAAVAKAQQVYQDSLMTLTEAESIQMPTSGNMSDVEMAAEHIIQQV